MIASALLLPIICAACTPAPPIAFAAGLGTALTALISLFSISMKVKLAHLPKRGLILSFNPPSPIEGTAIIFILLLPFLFLIFKS